MTNSLRAQFRIAMDSLESHHGSMTKAAEACGCSRQNWAMWKAGSSPRMETLEQVIAEAAKLTDEVKR